MQIKQINDDIILTDFSFSYDNVAIFEKISLTIPYGTKVGIYGPSGCGKTTLLLILAKKIKISNELTISGKSRMIYQYPQLNPYLTCNEIMEMEKTLNNTNLDISELIKKAKIENLGNRLVNQLSGGEKQKLTLICSLVSGARLILADEPFARLDKNNTTDLRNLLLNIIEEKNLTLIMASHYLKHFEGFDQIFEIKNKTIKERQIN